MLLFSFGRTVSRRDKRRRRSQSAPPGDCDCQEARGSGGSAFPLCHASNQQTLRKTVTTPVSNPQIANATFKAHLQVVESAQHLIPIVCELASACSDALRRGRKILWAGNGGSAADSQHLAAELVGRFERDRTALASLALTTDTSILTALGNDYGFERIFARQVQAHGAEGDVLIGISTSGNSLNIVEMMKVAARLGIYRAAFTGADGGRLAAHVDLCIRVPSASTARIQEVHILIGHILCDLLERSAAATGDAQVSSA